MIKFNKDDRFGFNRAEVTVASGQTSDPIDVDIIYSAITVAVIPSGTARCQYTICDRSLVESGTAHWFDWDNENVTENSIDTVYGVITALKLVSITGSATLKALSR